MNMMGCRRALLGVAGQLRGQMSRRPLCGKPQETKAGPPPTAPANTTHLGFKLPGYRPSDMDKKILIWSGRFKTADQIPEFVSFEMIDASRNRMRVKACYGMMVTTIAACLIMVILGKRAAGRQESLSGQNMEKKAKWRQEFQQQQQQQQLEAASTAAAMAGKPQ
ncbi:unnamed protein product [Lota lota]